MSSNFYEHLLEQSKIRHLSINEIERVLGYPRNSLNNYKYGSEPSATRLLDISHFFNVAPELLMGETDYPKREEVKDYFKNLPIVQKKELISFGQEWLLKNIQD